MPISVWVIAAFALGGLTGLVLGAGLFRGIRTRLEMQRLIRKLKNLEKDRASAGSSSVQDAE